MTRPLDAVARSLAAPIPGPSPVGADVTYEPEFERLRHAVDALASVGTAVDHENVGEGPFGGGGGGDYQAVVDDALAVLSEQSKDLRAAGYLVASLAHTDGAAGVAAGLQGLADMSRAFWADLFPTRPRARRSAFEYVTNKVQTAIDGWPAPTPDETEPLAQALDALDGLQALTTIEMGNDAPALSGLRRSLTQRQGRVPKDEPESPPEAAEPEPTSAPTSDAAPPPSRPAARPEPPAAGVEALSTDPVRAVYQAAAALREAEPSSAAAARLIRTVRWDRLEVAPPADTGKTRIEAPPARQRDALAVLVDADPEEFVEQAERAFVAQSAHLWLDLQRLADGALAGLGAPFAAMRAALRAETARLLERLPTLLGLQFRDGTPFADAATQGWARGLQTACAASASGPEPDGSDDLFAEVRGDVDAGRLEVALDTLARATPPAGRAGFVHRLQTASLCLDGGRADLAWGLLSALTDQALQIGLDAWEPGLAADLHDAHARASAQTDRPDEAASARARLAAVAPARAARYPAA